MTRFRRFTRSVRTKSFRGENAHTRCIQSSWRFEHRPIRIMFAVIVTTLGALAACGGVLAARAPTALERAGIGQAISDFFHAPGQVAHPVIRVIRVTTAAAPPPRNQASGYYSKFAAVSLYDEKGGGAGALLGYYVAPLSGWRVLGLGTAFVGCRVPASLFRGRKAAVLHDLGFKCPRSGR